MNKFNLQHQLYRTLWRPLLFLIDSEKIHNWMTVVGETAENFEGLVKWLFSYQNPDLHRKILGIDFPNPIGLAAGFDYDGHLAQIMQSVGFGFNTVGTVTAKPYVGNPPPRLGRLIKSRSLLVNKGFKSEGAIAIAGRLDQKNLKNRTIGISVGSSNLPSVNTINKAIDDYLFTFNVFKKKNYVKYFELNISCPNLAIKEPFTNPGNFQQLTSAVAELNLKQPIFVKMPNEINFTDSDRLVEIGLKNKIYGYIFSNLVKDRTNKVFVKSEIKTVKNLRGNFSGKPTFANSNALIKHARQKFGQEIVIIGCGGVFEVQDAIAKFKCGADLVQLITGMVFEGPQIAGEINQQLTKKLQLVK